MPKVDRDGDRKRVRWLVKKKKMGEPKTGGGGKKSLTTQLNAKMNEKRSGENSS